MPFNNRGKQNPLNEVWYIASRCRKMNWKSDEMGYPADPKMLATKERITIRYEWQIPQDGENYT